MSKILLSSFLFFFIFSIDLFFWVVYNKMCKGGKFFMIDDELKYLKLCGFKLSKDSTEVILKEPINSFFPKLSCILKTEKNDSGEVIEEGYEFVLHYSPDEGFSRCETHFDFDEAPELRSRLDDSLLRFFSIPDSFLKKVRKSRLGGRRPWKIRRFPLPIKKAKVWDVFGISIPKESNIKLTDLGQDQSLVDIPFDHELKVVAARNMQVCVKKAAEGYSLNSFSLYYEAWKDFYGGCGKAKAWAQFVKEVKNAQGV